jgi:radical SAM superfamily enzyme YgiQ (UPF0313 family)
VKTLLIHTPKFNNFYKPIGDFIWLNYMPMGLLAIADHLAVNGVAVQVVHLGVEWVENRAFNVSELLRADDGINAVGLSLHWHHQAFDVIEVARCLKLTRPELFIFLGGDTASYFHEEIIREFPIVDAVIRGHGEAPALALVKALAGERNLARVPNLTWRDGAAVRQNEMTYVADTAAISRLSYTNFSLLRHWESYVRYVGLPFFFAKGFSKEKNRKLFSLGQSLFPVPIGRGCPFNCTWCGGSQVPQQRCVSHLKGFLYRDIGSVVQSVRAAMAAGYRIMQSAMDPEPQTQSYFISLWRALRKEGLFPSWMFECNGLPTDEFLAEFKRTFPDRESLIALSPECGNEALRLRHKGPGFTTNALLTKLSQMNAMGIATEVFFTYGLPGENERLLAETIALQRLIAKRFRCVRAIRTLSVEMEPGAPWQIDPERFGIVTDRRTFKDFYAAHADVNAGTFTSFGYYIPDYFETPLNPERPFQDFAARMQAIKCRKFCFIHPNPKKCGKSPWQGRLFCGVASRLMSLKPRNFSRPY